MTELKNRVALITGASRGIGAAAARELAARGVSVILAARALSGLEGVAADIEAGGGKAIAVACDVTVYSQVEAAVAQGLRAFGQLDILINNAGTIEPIARLAESDPDAWGRAVDVNLKGVFHGLRATLPVMVGQKSGGVVVNLSSGAATSVLEGWSLYCSTKAAVLSLTRCAHKEYHDRGVRIIGLSPGTVETDMQVAVRASGINPVSRLDVSAHISATDAARAIAWACTEDAAEFSGTDFSLKTEEGWARAGLAT